MNWARAFARQAESDLAVREYLLRNAAIPDCHQLHYLQMAMEKLCKAHILAGGGSIRPVHGYVSRNIPLMVKEMFRRTRAAKDSWVIDAVRRLADRVETLAPAIERGGSVPANCEYPWQGAGGAIISPLDHDFGMDLLNEKAGRVMLKAARARLSELLAEPATDR